MLQRRVSISCSGKLQGGLLQDGLNIAYDNYPFETSKSLQSLMTGALVATYGFDTEFGYCSLYSVGLVPADTSL